MNENQQFSEQSEENIDFFTDQPNTYTAGSSSKNDLAKVVIGALIGATVGAIATALTIKGTTEKVDKAVKSV